ncbi:MAG: hypothetical protein JRJ00_00295 [Deltaproteobacteria bacterium]|nr:hypothetical protein [Deltaproteobacteria bacterium]
MSSLINEATIKGRRDTSTSWTANNPTLSQGEWGHETDTQKSKRGDGSTSWNSLDYAVDPTAIDSKITGSTDQICKAWVNFNGTGTVSIRDSFNVSSITDNNPGDYTVNITNALNNTNYCVVSSGSRSGSVQDSIVSIRDDADMLTTSVRIITSNGAAGLEDFDVVCIAIFST